MNNKYIKPDIINELKEIAIEDACDKLNIDYKGDCPSGHGSKNNNCFHTFPGTNSWYCFNCQEGGDNIKLVEIANNCSFTEACNYLMTNFRPDLLEKLQPINQEELQKIQEKRQKSELIYQALNYTMEYYQNILYKTPDAMDYLLKRGVKEEFIRSNPYVRFGHSPVYQNDLYKDLISKFGEDIPLATGLFKKTPSGMIVPSLTIWVKELNKAIPTNVYSYEVGGQTKYIIARRIIPGEDRFRKLITNNTEVRNEIFGIDSLSIRNSNFKDSLLLAEGLFDSILAVQNNIPCISPITTRFAEHQIDDFVKQAKRFKNSYIVPDPDLPGESGAVKTARRLFEEGKNVKVVKLPTIEGVKKFDLADYFQSHTATDFFELCKEGTSLTDFLIQTIPQETPKTELSNILDKKEVISLIKNMDAISREHYQDKLSERFSLKIDTVSEMFKEVDSTVRTKGKGETDSEIVQENKTVTPLTLTDLMNISGDIRTNYIVSDLFYRDSISIIFGEPGSGKTWLILDIIFNVAKGTLIWDKYKTDPHKVLLLEGDFSNLILKDRIRNFSLSGECIDNFRTITIEDMEKKNCEYCLDKAEGQKNIEGFIQQINPALVVIDSLGSFIAGDESKPDCVKSVINFLKDISQRYHIHIMIVHHSRKRTSLEKRDRRLDQSDMIGSSLFMRYASTLFSVNTIYEDEEKLVNKGLVVNAKNWFRPLPNFEYEITENDDGSVKVKYDYEKLSTAKTKKQAAIAAILDLLSSDPSLELSQEKLTEATNIDKRTIKDAVQELVRDEKITGIGESRNRKYRIKYISDIYVPDTIKQCPNNGKTYIYQ